MEPLPAHRNRYKKILLFFSFIKKKKKNVPSRTLISVEYNSAESLTNKYNLFGTNSKQTVS